MATPKIIADFETQLATALAIGGTSFTLASATDDDGVAIPNGLYYFTVDNGTSNKEYLAGTVAGTAVTSVLSVSRQGVETSGAARAHRVGASVIMTDFATYKKYMDEIALVSAPDASTIAKGVVEIATLAQVRAGTGTGETGAILVVSPTELDDMTTQDEKAAMTGDSATAPSSANPFVTKYSTRFGVRKLTAGETINGATLPVPVYQNKTDNEFYACDANDTAALKFAGFAISNGTNGATMDVQFNGVVTGFTNLLEGEKYYVQDAVGTINTTPGTYEVLVGRAISETELLIEKGSRSTAGAFATGTTSSSLAVTCGFRVSRVTLTGFASGAAGILYSGQGTYVNGTYSSISVGDTDGVATPQASASNIYFFEGTSGPTRWEFTITSITDTGFTITWTETGTMSSWGISYVAEGEI